MNTLNDWPESAVIAQAMELIRKFLFDYATGPRDAAKPSADHDRAMVVAFGIWYYDLVNASVAEENRDEFHKDIQKASKAIMDKVRAEAREAKNKEKS